MLNSYNEDMQPKWNSSISLNKATKFYSLNIFISWFFNLTLVLICLIVIFINGEPYIDVNLTNADTLWLHYQMTRKNFERKNYKEAAEYCQKVLKELGQQIPKTHFQLTVGIIR